MNGREVKQCEICRCLYTVAELEAIFTGRRMLVCQKCIKNGRKQAAAQEGKKRRARYGISD